MRLVMVECFTDQRIELFLRRHRICAISCNLTQKEAVMSSLWSQCEGPRRVGRTNAACQTVQWASGSWLVGPTALGEACKVVRSLVAEKYYR